MTRYHVGCMGWGYDDWVGPFYPPGTPASEFLPRYSRVFGLAEVDSSFYRPPSPFLASRWSWVTPAEFRFALKVPKDITHGAEAGSFQEHVRKFLEGIEPLRVSGKLGPLVAQFPPSFRPTKGFGKLEEILTSLPRPNRVAVELRHASWWTPKTRRVLEDRGAALVWAVLPQVDPPPWLTADFVYARFVGDRALTKFDHVQRDLRSQMEAMRDRFESEGLSALQVYALVNNHFMGFGPGTAQILQEVLGLPRSDLTAAARDPGQRAL